MSAPETKLREQEKRHRAPLLGMRAGVIFAIVLLALVTVFVVVRGNDPGEVGTGIDGTPQGAAVEQQMD